MQTYEVQLGRGYYHLQDQLADWLREQEISFTRTFAFGHQFFSFESDEDAKLFDSYAASFASVDKR